MSDDSKIEQNKVVAHFKDGRLLKGYTHDFTPTKEMFHLTSEEERDKGTIHQVKVSGLKALFFVKSLDGDRDYHEKKRFEEVDAGSVSGIKIRVEFFDGEIIRGVSLGYNKKKPGFFVIPVDPECNNLRVYVVADSCLDVKVGKAAEG